MRQLRAMLLCVGALGLVSLVLRVPCLNSDRASLLSVVPGCHGDLWVMWVERGLAEGRIPYLQPVLDATGQLVTVEYPVLTGLLMWLFGRTGSYAGFLVLSTVVMTLAALVIAWLLQRRVGRRAWLWAAAPALAHYLAYNYDALAAMTVVIALSLVWGRDPLGISRARLFGAAAVLGVGGAIKLYPLLFALPLALWVLFGRPGRDQPAIGPRLGRAALTGATAAVVYLLINLPFALANPQGWWLPFQFQAGRPIEPSTFSLWYLLSLPLPGVAQSTWMQVSTGATGLGIAAAAWTGWLAARRRGAFPLLATSLTVLIAYMLLNKVFSPQYVIWVLPLLVLSAVPARDVWVLLGIDVVMFWTLGFFGYGLSNSNQALVGALGTLLMLMVVVRLVYLAWLGVRTAWRPESAEPVPGEQVRPAEPSA